jgi:hypothetical protein
MTTLCLPQTTFMLPPDWTLLTDLLTPLENIQPEILGRFPRFRRFIIFQQDPRHLCFPCSGGSGWIYLDGIGLGCE